MTLQQVLRLADSVTVTYTDRTLGQRIRDRMRKKIANNPWIRPVDPGRKLPMRR